MVDRIRGRKLQQRRARLFSRQPLCVMCEANGRVTPAVEADHVDALHKGGADVESNLQALCAECHREKTAKDLGRKFRPAIGVDGWPVE